MSLFESLKIANAVIDAIQNQELTDDDLQRLQHIFPEQTIIGALDLVDRGNVLKYTTAWGHIEYEVIGLSGTYVVLLDINTTRYPYFCSCPAFVRFVLQQKNHLMCKHILATCLANRLSASIERQMQPDDLATLYMRRFSLTEGTTHNTTHILGAV